MRPVLFTSQRDLVRAENIKAVYDAYNGPKDFIKLNIWRTNTDIISGKYRVMVTDEIPAISPGIVIMIGHGIAGTKLYGLDQPRPYADRANARLINYVITQSNEPVMIHQVAKQHGVTESKVLPLGMARTDAYYGKHKGEGGTGYGDRILYLYAPTYKSKYESSDTRIDWRAIDAALTDDEILIVKPHMITKSILTERYKHIVQVSSDIPSTPYLIDCDVLITDYSSIMQDALVLRRPVVLFTKDLKYLSRRGMYFKYPDDYSRYYAVNESELIRYIRAAVWTDADEKRRRFFVPACDGHSTARIIKLIQEANNENIDSGTYL